MSFKTQLRVKSNTKIISSDDSLSATPFNVNAGKLGSTVLDLEIIIVLVLPALRHIPQLEHQLLILSMSHWREFETDTLLAGRCATEIRVASSA